MTDPKSDPKQDMPANDTANDRGDDPIIEDSFATGANAGANAGVNAGVNVGTNARPAADDKEGEPLDPASMLSERVQELEAEKEAQRDQLLRMIAEAENGKRRAQREKEDAAKFAISKFARDVLDISDNLRRALEVSETEGMAPVIGQNEQVKVLVEGVAATERALLQAFEKNGLVKLQPLDEKFDPNYHQAMIEIPTADKPPGTVVQVMQAGYVLNGRLIRPALVGVAKGEAVNKVDTTA